MARSTSGLVKAIRYSVATSKNLQDLVRGMAVQAALEEVLRIQRFQNIDTVEHGFPRYDRQHHIHSVAVRLKVGPVTGSRNAPPDLMTKCGICL